MAGHRDRTNRRARRVRTMLGALSLATGTAACTAPAAPAAEPATPTGAAAASPQQRPFAADSAWNTPIPARPRLAANSSAVVAHLATGVHANLYAYGTPVYWVTGASPPRQDVRCLEDWGPCRLTGVPIPAGARPATGSDGAMVVVDAARRQVVDFWRARATPAGWETAWGTRDPLYGTGTENGGAVGAGISGLAGLVRRYEIRDGRIDHALHFSSDASCAGRFQYPATKTDGTATGAACLPEGARVQLDPSIDVATIPGITRGERTVARALQTYGAYDRDTGDAPMAIGFEDPAGRADPYPAAGLSADYYAFPHIPWDQLRFLAGWNGR